MSNILFHASNPGDARWSYDDPSGVADPPLAVRVPEALRGSVELAAARDGLSPGEWLITLVTRSLLSGNSPKVA